MKNRTIVLERTEATDRAVAAIVYRHIGDPCLEKIEVRYSTRAPAISHSGIQHQLLELARRQPLPRIDLSCRAHDNYIDDATGETQIRILYRAKAGEGVFQRALAGIRTLVGKDRPVVAEALQEQAIVARIRASLKQNAAAYLSEFKAGHAPAVAQVSLVIREPQIDAMMQRMSRPEDLATWLHRQLTMLAVPVATEIMATYEYRPYRASEGTDLLGGGDVEIVLGSVAAVETSQEVETQEGKAHGHSAAACDSADQIAPSPQAWSASASKANAQLQGTLPPDWVTENPYVVELEIEMPRPPTGKGRLRLDRLPARLDRALLIEAGLGEYAPHAAQIASNQTPLEIDVTPAGHLHVNAGLRSGLRVPMYYLGGIEPTGIIGPRSLPTPSAQIVVNSPEGVVHPDRGHLDPILVRLNVHPRTERREAAVS